tara:strand:+ start:577 stop:795 length:219 start_codon:yes stop_codon:yes gene_type:complete
MFYYAVAVDSENVRNYLVANSEQEIDTHCVKNNYKVLAKPKYVEPGMVAHNFIWVGVGKRPALLDISKPHNY